MKDQIVIQELKAVQKQLVKLCSSDRHSIDPQVALRNDQVLRPSISRLSFCIATLEAKESDTVRLPTGSTEGS